MGGRAPSWPAAALASYDVDGFPIDHIAGSIDVERDVFVGRNQVFGGGRPWYDVTHPSFAGGAKLDGVTNDGPAANAALLATTRLAPDGLPGGIVFEPPGTLFTLVGLVVRSSGTTWMGSGRGVSRIKAGAVIDPLFGATNFSQVVLIDTELDGNLLTNKIVSMASTGGVLCRDLRVERCRLRRNSATATGWTMVFWDTQQASAYGGVVQRVRFFDNIVEDCTSTIIDQMTWAFCTDVEVRGNTFNNIGRVVISFFSLDSRVIGNHFGTFLAYANLVMGSTNETVQGNTFDTCGFPIRMDGAIKSRFVGNVVDNMQVVIGQIQFNTDLELTGNWIRGTIGVSGVGGVNARILIAANSIRGTAADHHIQVDPLQLDVVIEANVITSETASPLVLIQTQSDWTIIKGNKLRASGSVSLGISLNGASHCVVEGNVGQGFGAVNWIREFGAANNNRLLDNKHDGSAAGYILLGANTVMRWNTPGNPAGAVATPGFPATTVAVANNTNFDVVAYGVNGANALTIQVDAVAALMIVPANASFTVRVPANSTFTPTYAGGAPVWKWYGE